MPLPKPGRVERARPFSRSDICGRDAFHPPHSPLRGGCIWIRRPHHHSAAWLCRGRVPGALLRLQSCKSHQAGMLMHTSGTISSVSGEANKTVSKSQTGDPLAGGKFPPRKSCPRRHRPRHQGKSRTRCLPSTGCQDSSSATLPAGASARRHTSGHQPLKGHKRWGGCMGSRVKALHSSSCPAGRSWPSLCI